MRRLCIVLLLIHWCIFGNCQYSGQITTTGGAPVNLRETPSLTGTLVGQIPSGQYVNIQCSTQGQSVGGNTFWYFIPQYNGYLPSAVVDIASQFIPPCSKTGVFLTNTP